MTFRTAAAAALLMAMSACATAPVPVSVRTATPTGRTASAPAPVRDGVIGLGAAQLQAMFGTPFAQVTEGSARKLQFAGAACVLDAYLYPRARGGEPEVTHVDTRRPTGEDTDRASCVAALRVSRDS